MNTGRQAKFREWAKTRLGALSLVCILVATFTHTAGFMAQFFYNNYLVGCIAAFAIDAGVVAMAFYKDEILANGDWGGMVRAVTILVLLASGVANVSEGFESYFGQKLTWSVAVNLDWITLTIWVAGSAIWPLLAYVMTDTIGVRGLQALQNGFAEFVDEDGHLVTIEEKEPAQVAAKNHNELEEAEV